MRVWGPSGGSMIVGFGSLESGPDFLSFAPSPDDKWFVAARFATGSERQLGSTRLELWDLP